MNDFDEYLGDVVVCMELDLFINKAGDLFEYLYNEEVSIVDFKHRIEDYKFPDIQAVSYGFVEAYTIYSSMKDALVEEESRASDPEDYVYMLETYKWLLEVIYDGLSMDKIKKLRAFVTFKSSPDIVSMCLSIMTDGEELLRYKKEV